jgi:thioredoxin-like negative regulator of GroEL
MVLLKDKLDDFSRDLQAWLENNKLDGDPASEPAPPGPEKPDTAPDQPEAKAPTLDDARKFIRRGEYTEAYKVLDLFVTEDAEPEVYHLLFVVLTGRGELADASVAFQTWFLKVSDEERTRLNALRELFSSRELFDQWRDQILAVRTADPNAGLPRLLNCYVEITGGRYAAARTELVVAKIESPANPVVQALERILDGEGFQNDRTPDGIQDDLSAKALLGQADREFRAGNYSAALSGYLAAAEADRNLPFMTLTLMRCYFALGDYDNATAQLKLLFSEQGMAEKEARDFKLALESGYDNAETFNKQLAALKLDCETRNVNASRWMLYGVILLARNDYTAARDALQLWYDLDTAKTRDPVIVKFCEYARKRAS